MMKARDKNGDRVKAFIGQASIFAARAAEAIGSNGPAVAKLSKDLSTLSKALVTRLGELDRQQRADRPACVVVVGETKAGKSSLVNALLGKPGLSPVDASVATNAHIQFSAAGPEGQHARVHFEPAEETDDDVPQVPEREPLEIELSEISLWATKQGNQGNAQGVRWVEVELDTPLLEQLTIVDTPGVGGVLAQHRALTMFSLKQAHALLFAVPADREISRSGLTFLEQAAEHIDTVIVAVTKSDVYLDSYEILAEDRRLLKQHADRFGEAPIVLVSSKDAEDALDEPDHDYASELRETSRVPEIDRLLRAHVAGRADELAWLNATLFSMGALTTIERSLRDSLEAVRGGPEFELEAKDKLEALKRDRAAAQASQHSLTASLNAFKTRRTNAFDGRVLDLSREYVDRVRGLSGSEEELNKFGGDLLDALVAAELQLDLQTMDTIVAEVLAPVLEKLHADSSFDPPMDEFAGDAASRAAGLSWPTDVRTPASTLAEQAQTAVLSTAGPRSLMAILAGFGITFGGPAGAVVTLALGWGYWRVIKKGKVASAEHAEREAAVRSHVNDTAQRIRNDYSDRMTRVQTAMLEEVIFHINQRIEQIESAIGVHQDAKRKSKTEREKLEGLLRDNLQSATARAKEASDLLEELRGRTHRDAALV